MLQRSSLERKEFKEDELKLIKKFDVKNLAVIFPENLNYQQKKPHTSSKKPFTVGFVLATSKLSQ